MGNNEITVFEKRMEVKEMDFSPIKKIMFDIGGFVDIDHNIDRLKLKIISIMELYHEDHSPSIRHLKMNLKMPEGRCRALTNIRKRKTFKRKNELYVQCSEFKSKFRKFELCEEHDCQRKRDYGENYHLQDQFLNNIERLRVFGGIAPELLKFRDDLLSGRINLEFVCAKEYLLRSQYEYKYRFFSVLWARV